MSKTFAAYLSVSALCLLLDYALYLSLLFVLPPVPAGVISYATAAVLHYILSKRHVFTGGGTWLDGKPHAELALYIASAVLGSAMTAGTLWVVHDVWNVPARAAKVFAIATSFFAVYGFRKYVIFRSHSHAD